MTATKALLLVACGAVQVGASECSNTTFLEASEQFGRVTLDLKGNAWFISNSENSSVWRCPTYDQTHQCQEMGGGGWRRPRGIAVTELPSGDGPYVFIAESGTVKQCTWNDHEPFTCIDYGSGSGWSYPLDVIADQNGNIFVLDMPGKDMNVWKCPPYSMCSLVTSSELLDSLLAVDSQGTIYATGSGQDSWWISRCPSTGNCSTFYSGSRHDLFRQFNAAAVGPDDSVYLSFTETCPPDHECPPFEHLIRCSPDREWDEHNPDYDCEDLGAFDGDGKMVIDENGVFYTAGGGLRRICLSPSMQDIQV